MMNIDSYVDARLNQGKFRDHIYIHMSAINDSYTNNMNLQLQYSRDEAFINNPFLYKCAISKMTIDTYGGSMPLMMPKMLIGLDENGNTNTNVNKLAYSFTLQYYVSSTEIYEIQKYVIFIPQNTTTQPTAYVIQDVSSDYYYIYSYDYFVKLLNNTLEECYDALNGAVTGGISSYAPFLSLADNILIFNGDKTKYDLNLTTPRIKIFCNTPMYELLNGFQWNKQSIIADGKNYQLNLTSENSNTLSLDNYDALTQLQIYSSLSNWNPVQSIVITTNNIPIESQMMAPLQILEPKQVYNDGNKQSLNILTNLDVDLTDNPTGYLPQISYGTSNNYRFVDLKNALSFNNIDISVYWLDHYQRLHPMFLAPQAKASIDLVFVNRNVIIN